MTQPQEAERTRGEWPEPAAVANPEMLRLARGAFPMTQEELADRIKTPQARISRWEDGLCTPLPAELEKASAELMVPIELFFQHAKVFGFGTCCLYHRKRRTLPVKTLNVIHDRINVLRIGIARLLSTIAEIPVRFDRMDIEDYDNPESIARLVRGTWQLPFGPIQNLVETVEAAGGIVIQCCFGTDKLDAVSQWPPGMPPLFFLNKDCPADRSRFSLAHEVAHIFMHRIPTPAMEDEADQFASEFLMPERDIDLQLTGMSLENAMRLKPRWRVSIQALFRRAKDLGAINASRYTSLCAYLSSLGYRKREPNPLPPEAPSTLQRIVDAYSAKRGYGLDDIGRVAFCLDGQQFEEKFFGKTPQPGPFRVIG